MLVGLRQEEIKKDYREVEKFLRVVVDGDLEMVCYLLEWMEEDLEDVEEIVSVVDFEFCYFLCQCFKCVLVQKRLVKVFVSGFGVNVISQDGFFLLYVVVLYGWVDFIFFLLKYGVNVGVRNVD